MSDANSPRSLLLTIGLLFALAAGVCLRLVWVQDMEFKGDEAWTFHRTQVTDPNDPHPWLGMPTSYELRHPSGTVYIFQALAWLFDANTPETLARACQLTNCFAILLMVIFARFCVPAGDREVWYWGAALVSVNPIEVLLHRKIWPPSIAPLFVLLFLIAFWYRDRRAGAILWGLSGLVLAQIHPAGMFASAGFAAWVFLLQRRSARWRYWLLGSAVGFVLLVPWLHYAFETMRANPISQRKIGNAFEFKFWFRWVTESFGFSLSYALGDDFLDFLEGPRIGGIPTGIAGIFHAVLLGCMGWLAFDLCKRGWANRSNWLAFLRSEGKPTRFLFLAGCLGFGIAFTASLLPVHRHYMLLTFPLMFLSLAYCALCYGGGRRLLTIVCIAQWGISILFLVYVHQKNEPIRGDYGAPYRMSREK